MSSTYDYLVRWIAYALKNPAKQGEVAVVLKGKEGTGKGTLAKIIMHLLGQHAMAVSNARHLVGNFNAHLRDAIFLFADEAFLAGDKQHIGVLKSLITESHLAIEAKYHDPVLAPNYLHIMMASNEEWVVPASIEARRFFVLLVGDEHMGDHYYFGAIWKEMKNGGVRGVLARSAAMDLTTFNVRDVPKTDGLQQQKIYLPNDRGGAWWLDCPASRLTSSNPSSVGRIFHAVALRTGHRVVVRQLYRIRQAGKQSPATITRRSRRMV